MTNGIERTTKILVCMHNARYNSLVADSQPTRVNEMNAWTKEQSFAESFERRARSILLVTYLDVELKHKRMTQNAYRWLRKRGEVE